MQTINPPTECARLAADAVRDLNHRTIHRGDARGYNAPADTYAVLGALVELVGMLPQALDQLSQWLDTETELRRVASVPGWPYAGDPEAAAAAISQHVSHAKQALAFVRDHLACAHEAAAGLATADEDGAR